MDFGKATIIAAVVTGFFSFIMMIVREFITNKGIRKDMQDFKDCIFGDLNTLKSGQTESRGNEIGLSKEHSELSKEHICISNGLENMSIKVDKTAEIIANIDMKMQVTEAKEQERLKVLSEKQIDLISIAEKIGNMAEEIKTQQENISNLQKELAVSREENTKLKEEIRKLQRDKRSFEMPDMER